MPLGELMAKSTFDTPYIKIVVMDTKTHIIKNFESLASSSLRKQALLVAEAGYAAINTRQAVRRNFRYDQKKQRLKIFHQEFDLRKFKRVVCVGFGKAAFEAIAAIQEILRDRIAGGFVLDVKAGSLEKIVCRVGTHPFPSKANMEATDELVEMLEACREDDLVICAVSGGGSALLCRPYQISFETERAITEALTAKGATIQEVNTVRKHISRVKGGNLAKIIYPATCVSLIFSDVPGDDIAMVASGPTVKDLTTNADAAAILAKYKVLERCGLPSCHLAETPKEDKYFSRAHNILFVSARQALNAMANRAEELGLQTEIFAYDFQGLAQDLALQITARLRPGVCLLGAGESTVKLTGKGKGGRNQELALAALKNLHEHQVLACLASDGRDNTEAAGAIVDSQVLTRAERLRLRVEDFVQNNDSFNFFDRTGDLAYTGNTGSNVSDFFVGVAGR